MGYIFAVMYATKRLLHVAGTAPTVSHEEGMRRANQLRKVVRSVGGGGEIFWSGHVSSPYVSFSRVKRRAIGAEELPYLIDQLRDGFASIGIEVTVCKFGCSEFDLRMLRDTCGDVYSRLTALLKPVGGEPPFSQVHEAILDANIGQHLVSVECEDGFAEVEVVIDSGREDARSSLCDALSTCGFNIEPCDWYEEELQLDL